MQILLCILLSAVPQWELTTSLSYVYNAVPDGEGGVWCASSGGAFNYSPSQGIGTVFSCPEHLPVPDCRDVLQDSAGRLWFATGGDGLVMYDGENWISYSSFEGIPGQGVVTSLVETAGEIWVGCSGGFAHGGVNGFTPVGAAFTADDVYNISPRNDTLWLCTNKGIYSLHDPENPLNPSSWKHWPETQNLQLTRVRTGVSSVYACGDSGAVELLPGADRFQYILDYSLAEDSAVIDLMEIDGELLAACHGMVLVRNGSGWQPLGTGIPQYFWPTCLFTVEGAVHCGFSYQTALGDLLNTQSGLGFYVLSQDKWSNYPIPGMQCTRVHQMDSRDDGSIYVGTYLRGVQAFYPGYGWRSYMAPDGMPNAFQTFSVAADPQEGVWTSSYHHGLSWIKDNGDWFSQGDTILTFVRDTLEQHSQHATIIKAEIPNNQPVMLASQSNGMWAAFQQFDPAGQPDEPSGIAGFNGDPMGTMNWAQRVGGSGIAAVNVQGIYPTGGDSLWIAFKNGAGCQLLVHSGDPSDPSEDSWFPAPGQAYTTSDGLPSGEVFCFCSIPGVGVVVGTSSGLARWTGDGFAAYQDITEGVRSISTDSYGRIWCLAESGIYRVADGEVSFYNGINSDYKPSALYDREYTIRDEITGGVYFSSIKGLWLVTQAGGGSGGNDSGLSFYPQPFISGEDVLRFTGIQEGIPIAVDFFRLNGSHIGTLEAATLSEWSWDGALNGKIVASGVYMLLVSVGETVYQHRISVVR